MATISTDAQERLMSKVRWRIVPFVFLLYIIAMIDRVNIGFTALKMNKDLGISASMFGLIAGIFFIAYFFFEVPSNVIMHKVGARKWIARILVSWGLVVILTGFVQSSTQFLVVRTLLGLAEAGFYPGIILYFTFWFPSKYMARTVSMFMTAMAAANIIAGPLSTFIMDNVQWLGLTGWRWVFILEGLPAIVFGVLTFIYMIDRPEQAKFMTKEEKEWLTAELKREHEAKMAKVKISKWEAMKNGRVWYMAIIYLGYVIALYGLGLWLPQLLKGLAGKMSDTQIGLVSVIPYLCGVVAMVLVARHSDKTMERRFHVGLPLLFAAVFLVSLTLTKNLTVYLIYISLATAGIYAFVGSFWSLPNAFLSEATAAVGIAVINSVGNLGGFFGPYVVGYLKDLTHSNTFGMYVLAAFAILAAVLTMAIPKNQTVAPSDAHNAAK